MKSNILRSILFLIMVLALAATSTQSLSNSAGSVAQPVVRDPTKTTYLQFSDRIRLPLNVFFSKDGRFDEPVTFGMSSDPEVYKARVRQRLDKLLSSSRSDAE